MQLSQMQSEVALVLGNMQTSDPFYRFIYPAVGAETNSWINKSANKLVRMIVAKIPEIYKASWTIGPTVAGVNYVAKPADAISVQVIDTAHQSTLPNWSTTRTYPVMRIEPEQFDLLDKSATTNGYPSLYTEKGKQIFLWPTPTAAYVDYLHVYGVMQETVLVNATDSLFIEEFWHDYVVQLAIAMGARQLGWPDAAERYTAVLKDIGSAIDPMGLRNTGNAETMSVDGAPTRTSVYGGVR